jgi:hypothetical protein
MAQHSQSLEDVKRKTYNSPLLCELNSPELLQAITEEYGIIDGEDGNRPRNKRELIEQAWKSGERNPFVISALAESCMDYTYKHVKRLRNENNGI